MLKIGTNMLAYGYTANFYNLVFSYPFSKIGDGTIFFYDLCTFLLFCTYKSTISDKFHMLKNMGKLIVFSALLNKLFLAGYY